MIYTLSRFEHLKPTPPFQLAGEYQGRDGRHVLKDALNSIVLLGPESAFTGLQDGDLIVATVTKTSQDQVYCEHTRVTVRPRKPSEVRPKPHAHRFTAFLRRVNDFFLAEGLRELITPTLVRCPGLEPTLEPFATELVYGRHKLTAYLPTSPEVHLKKALARGWTDIFEIKTCFRKGEFSTHHENEFHMLEWYRAFAGLELIEQDLRRLLSALHADGWIEGGEPKVTSTDFAELFRGTLQFELTPTTTADELRQLCDRTHVHWQADDSFNDLFHRLLIDRIDPVLAQMGPVIVKRFPPSQAALAKLDKDGWADRMELYWGGLEIANGFNEVNEPDEQMRRWQVEIDERKRLGTSDVPHDPELIEAMRRGMPPCGGIALGVERLYMACAGVGEIQELRLFPARDLFT